MAGKLRRYILGGVVGILLGSVLSVTPAAQPFTAQIQRALNFLLAGTNTWTGSNTFQNVTVNGTCTGCGAAVPGSDTQVIFNDGGTALGADAGLVYNKTTDVLTTTVLDLLTTGVRATGADGVLTLLGLGNGTDENITFDLDNGPANSVAFGSGTGVDTWEWRNSTTAQTLSIFSTYTSSTINEFLQITSGAGDMLFWTRTGSGGGTARALAFGTDSTRNWRLETDGDFVGLNDNYALQVGLTGTRFSSANGALTLLSLGSGADENLTIDGNTTTNVVNLASTTGAFVAITSRATAGTAPTVANVGVNSCGQTAATLAGNDNAGAITVGTVSGTQCRITFSKAALIRRHCTFSNETTANLARSTYVDASNTDLLGTLVGGDVVTYLCDAR